MKGITYINKAIQYRIHATDRINEEHGLVIVDADLDEFKSRVTIFENGKVLVQSPHRTVEISLKEGVISCE
ncbi:hypothetical protein JXA80_07670 [bacterium]|nr:hypothetical protein [candidate division CSSED10-310 bacterium]